MAALVCINSKRFYSTTIKLSVETKTYFLYERQNFNCVRVSPAKMSTAQDEIITDAVSILRLEEKKKVKKSGRL